MRIAFAIVALFPGGGLQRDCVALARIVREHGHQVVIFTTRRDTGFADDLEIRILPVRAWTNHGRNWAFGRALSTVLAEGFDRVIGFDKLPELDLLYCADACVAAHPYGWRRLLPRYRTLIALERACFAPGNSTRILLLSERQAQEYRAAWSTESERLILIPPVISRDRRQPHHRREGKRRDNRASIGANDSETVWLAICTQPEIKGLDRTIHALPAFPRARLWVAGLERSSRRAGSVARLAERLGVAGQVTWLGFRNDIPELMAGADLLVHPARYDTTGTVILEAVVNGLPVVTTSACGFASHVEAAAAGIVMQEPFDSRVFAAALARSNDPVQRRHWSSSGIAYGENDALYQGMDRAANTILAPVIRVTASARRACRPIRAIR